MLRLVGRYRDVNREYFRVRRVASPCCKGIVTTCSPLLKLRLEVILDIVGSCRSSDCMMRLQRSRLLLREELGWACTPRCSTFHSIGCMVVSSSSLLVLIFFALLAWLRRVAPVAAGAITVMTLLVVLVGSLGP